jgi:transketolase C-terminal domain/subunit
MLQASFDELVDRFEDADDMTLEDIQLEVHQKWRAFLAAGFDATMVAKMMSDEDTLSYARALLDSGADARVVNMKTKNMLTA